MADDPRTYLGVRLKGRYLIEDHIGSGLSAHAFRAYDTLLQGRVVVKIIKSAIAGVAIDLGESWKEESRKAMQVRGHPHIASILDLGEEQLELSDGEETLHFIVTEFIEGKTLRDLAADRVPLDASALLTICHQLLGTLDFLQARKLSHDDLHAGNIMVSHLGADKPFIKVIDFGMASNTLIPKSREKDIHFALNQLDHLCQKSLAIETESTTRSILEGLAALLKKAQNFIPTGRMQIADVVGDIEILLQELSKSPVSGTRATTASDGPRRRIDIIRRTPFIGRESEIERLYGITTGAFVSKQGAMMFISGEAGIGKTRLVDEILGRVATERKRHLLLYNRCNQEPTLPYTSLFKAITDFLDDIPGQDDEEKLKVVLGSEHTLAKPVANLISEYRNEARGKTDRNADGSASANTEYLITGFLTQTALNTPIVLFLDDLHWADTATIEFLEFLAPRIKEAPIVVFGTHRPEDLSPDLAGTPHPLAELHIALENESSCRFTEITGLERENVEEILSNIYRFVVPADFTTLSDAVRNMAGGNPFYLFEIIGLMEDENILVERGENSWVLESDLNRFLVPDSINELIHRRVDKLTLNEILFLRSAALQGDTFDLNLLKRMYIPPEGDIDEILGSLLSNHGIIKPRTDSQYAFCHHQIRRAILRNIPPDDVERGHGDIARLLLDISSETKAPIPHHLVAHHLMRSGETKSATQHFHAAGKRALNALHFHLAVDHLRHATDLLSTADMHDDLAIDITLDLLEAVKPVGDRKLHEVAIHQLQAIAGHSERKDLELRALLEECIYLRMLSENEKSLKVANNLVELAKDADNEAIEAAALKEAGTTSYLMGNMEEAEEHFHQAAGILASTGDRAQLARVYNNLGLVCRNTMRQGEMIRYFNRALEIFREIKDNIGQRFPLGNLGIVYFERGEYERAMECFLALKASLGGQADLMMEAKVDFSMGEIYLEVGLLDYAREACERALQTFMTIGNRQGESEVLGTLGGIHLAKGDIQIARGYFERSIEVKKAIGNMVGMLHSQITLARIANMEGRHEEAIRISKEVLESAKQRNLRSIELECLTELMSAKAQLEDAASALSILTTEENPENLTAGINSALITFAFKVGELAFQAGDESKALDYIGLSGKIVEDILESISEAEWREAYEHKRERILETYRRLKPAIAHSDLE